MSYVHVTSKGFRLFDLQSTSISEDEIKKRIGCPIDRDSEIKYLYNEFSHRRKVICFDPLAFKKHYPFTAHTCKGQPINGEFIIAWIVIGYGEGRPPMLSGLSPKAIEISLKELQLTVNCTGI